MNLKTLTPESRKAIADLVILDIEASMVDRGKLPEVWRTDESLYQNQPPTWINPFMPQAPQWHFPLTQPRINKLAGQTVRTICQPDTILIGNSLTQRKRMSDVENALQFFCDIGALEPRLRRAAETAGCTDHAVIRTRFDVVMSDMDAYVPENAVALYGSPVRYAGFDFSVIHPNDFMLYPNTPYGISAARTVGHRFWLTVGHVKEQQKIGRYFKDVEVHESDGPATKQSGKDFGRLGISHSYSDKETQWVECFECVVRLDLKKTGKFQRYLVRLDYNSRNLLSIEEFPYQPWYAKFNFRTRQNNSFWSDRSVAKDMRPLQLSYNALHNLFIWGMHMNALPAIIGKGLPEKTVKYFAGDVLQAKGEFQAVPITSNFRTQEFPLLISQLERIADSVAHINTMGTGGQLRADATASEVMALQQASSEAQNDYLLSFGEGIIEVWQSMREQLHETFYSWKPIYGEGVALSDPNALLETIRFELHGRSPGSTPHIEVAKFEALLQKAQMYGDVHGRFPGQLTGLTPEGAPAPGLFDTEEILRSLTNKLGISNAEKVMPENEDAAGYDQGDVSQMAQMAVESGQVSPDSMAPFLRLA